MLLFTMVFSLVALAQSPDMEARGTLNGCQDGKSVASNSDWYLTLNSIMNNQSIDLNHRVAYYEAFMSCRRNRLQGEKNNGGLSDWFYEHNNPGHKHEFHPNVE